jgi:riboflavin kinase/FMN adenylyltransferase
VRVYRSLDEAPPDFGPSALTIGNFDGVHYGHRRILRRLREIAGANGWKPSVLTFDPHPTRVVAPDRAPALMTTPLRRAELMREEGIEQVLILPFTREIAGLSPEQFVRDLLVERLGARAVLVGDNFRFGHKAAGNVEVLAELGRRFGFLTEVVPSISWRGRTVSSSAIRDLVRTGRVNMAARLLQRAFALEGAVVAGRGVGSKQTVPTLNLAPETDIIPASGVYVTHTRDLGANRDWDSITNVGYRPTFGASDQLSIETFLLDPFDGPAPQRIRVEFLHRIRDERQFPDPAALKAQILRDVAVTKRYFRRARGWIGRVPCTSS